MNFSVHQTVAEDLESGQWFYLEALFTGKMINELLHT